jgi:hypothetical protein
VDGFILKNRFLLCGLNIQGEFLFFFDLFHALACPDPGIPEPKETP